VALARSFAAAATRRRELGESNALEALQASVALANAERRQAEAAGDLAASAAALRSLLALPPEQRVRVTGDLAEAAPLPPLAEVDARLLETNPEIAAATQAAEVARAQQAVVASERLPEFGFEVARQTVAGTAGYYGGNVRLGLPLFRLFNRGPDRAAEAATAIAEAQRERVVRAVQARIHASYAELTAARAQVATFAERLLPQAERAYDIALQLHASGEASYLEVLAAQTALIETQSSYVGALHTAARLRAEIEAITGETVR
jgi:cobalt-zinc-cadmium efflux system outer membrane protein